MNRLLFVPLRSDRRLLRQVWSCLPVGMVPGAIRPILWRRPYGGSVSVRVVEVELVPFQLSLPLFEEAAKFPPGFVGSDSACGGASVGVITAPNSVPRGRRLGSSRAQ